MGAGDSLCIRCADPVTKHICVLGATDTLLLTLLRNTQTSVSSRSFGSCVGYPPVLKIRPRFRYFQPRMFKRSRDEILTARIQPIEQFDQAIAHFQNERRRLAGRHQGAPEVLRRSLEEDLQRNAQHLSAVHAGQEQAQEELWLREPAPSYGEYDRAA